MWEKVPLSVLPCTPPYTPDKGLYERQVGKKVFPSDKGGKMIATVTFSRSFCLAISSLEAFGFIIILSFLGILNFYEIPQLPDPECTIIL